MKKFIDKNREKIGLVLIVIILVSSAVLIYQKQKSPVVKPDQTLSENNTQDLVGKINELEERIRKLEERKGEVAGATNQQSQSGKININVAEKEILESLPGIGVSRAQAIIDYRNSHNGFKSISELQNIKGIGPSIYGQIKDKVTINN